jgi:tRNA U34 5-carboxymethylaminomethyl modifying enzyme MnmG/GidA
VRGGGPLSLITLTDVPYVSGRLKTGTPPRLVADTIDWDILEPQPSDMPPRPFSYLNAEQGVALKDQLIQVRLAAILGEQVTWCCIYIGKWRCRSPLVGRGRER